MLGHRRLVRFPILALACVCFWAAAARAADWPVPRGPSNEPEPYRYDAARWKQVPHEFLEDAPACILYAGTTYLVEADGTTENIVHDITRFNGRKGIDKLGEYRNISYDPAYQKLTLNEARIHKADGHVVAIEPRDVQLRDLSTDYQVYDHEKQLIISFPNLEVGDTIEVKWTVRGKNPEYQGHFFNRYVFGDDHYPVVRDELRLRLPKDMPLKHATINGKLEPVTREEGGFRFYQWQATNRRELPQDENLPSHEDLRLQLAMSTFQSWDEVGQWKQQLRADCWECTAEVRKRVEDITRDLKTPLEKARALTYWVRRHVRYVSLGEKHDYTPHSPGQVLTNRFGDCKDQSQLLAVMLREAGVPVALATLGVLDDGQVLEGVPAPWGTHAILLVTIDGQDHWIDTTASLAGWDSLPRDDRDRLCYVVDDKGHLRLVRTPTLTASDNRIEQATRITVAADGSSRCVRDSAWYGVAAMVQRDNWVEVPPGERRRVLTSELQDANSRARLVKLTVDDKQLEDFDQPVRGTVVFDISNHFGGDPDREGSVADSKVWSKLLSINLDYDRTVPLDLSMPFESVQKWEITLPVAYRFDGVPREKNVRSKWGAFQLTVKADGEEPRRIELEMRTRLDQPKIEPADFEEFRKFHEAVSKDYRVWFTLKPVTDLEEAPELEKVLTKTPEDSGSAVVLARLYQQHNRSKDARRVLQRALRAKPNDAALWELNVKLADKSEEETAYAELVKRFPDEPKYAVAMGAALVTRGQHDKARAVLEPIAKAGAANMRGLASYHLARSSFEENKPQKALEHLEAAAKADPDSLSTVAALTFKGRVLEKVGRAKEAVEAYEQAVKVDAEAEEALLALVRLSLAVKDGETAVDYLRRYTVAVGDDPDGLANAAEWNLRMNRLDEASNLAARATENGKQPKASRVLGLVHLRRGLYEEAAKNLANADVDAEVLDGLIRSHLVLGDLDEAEADAKQLDKVSEPPAELQQRCGRVRELAERRTAVLPLVRGPADKKDAQRQAATALVCAEWAQREGMSAEVVTELLKEAFVEGVEVGPAFALRGLLALEKGRLTKALTDAEKAVTLAPSEPRGYYVRGRVRLERGIKEALADLEKAVELTKRKDANALYWQAVALAQAGRAQEALPLAREAVQQSPQDPDFVEQVRELEKGSGPNR
jgi:tetratricopeptide (TPR) repeat protein